LNKLCAHIEAEVTASWRQDNGTNTATKYFLMVVTHQFLLQKCWTTQFVQFLDGGDPPASSAKVLDDTILLTP